MCGASVDVKSLACMFGVDNCSSFCIGFEFINELRVIWWFGFSSMNCCSVCVAVVVSGVVYLLR